MKKIKKTKKASFDQISKNIRDLFLELSKEEILESTSIDQVQSFLDEIQNNISVQKTILEHMESIRLLRRGKEGGGDKGKKNKKPREQKQTNAKQGRGRAKKMTSSNDDEIWIDDGPLVVKKARIKEEYMDDTPSKRKGRRGTQQSLFS